MWQNFALVKQVQAAYEQGHRLRSELRAASPAQIDKVRVLLCVWRLCVHA